MHGSMNQRESIYGALHPDAPQELARFAFLIGTWRCFADLLAEDGQWHTFPAAWIGRYILDGLAIADEYRMHDLTGNILVHGLNFRSFNTASRCWNIRWLDARTGSWTDLCPNELGGPRFTENSISYIFREPGLSHQFTRATYTSLSPVRFTWHGERSADRINWTNFMRIDCHRA